MEKKWKQRWIEDDTCDMCGSHISGIGAKRNGQVICLTCLKKVRIKSYLERMKRERRKLYEVAD